MLRRSLLRIAVAASLVASIALPAAALDRRVRIINNTKFTIVEFYGSHTGTTSWQEDILGRDVLPPGNSVNINFDDGTGYCVFDFKAVFNDGDVLEKYGVNVCEIGSYTYY
ncbi:hypothetical protein [Phaeovulum sp.]|uniref:hypothetical protein n=1 Tax=Phaeovulum sp. TaxID=2934796 RepID=UPI00272F222F|nr:hypothetical protein [Phaeovulum sp.]MDP1670427.1 hypothetical protein [Phaeovulum sp.]MDZ4120752.1 hypothetical protein [Phaeovulum sp.]